MKKTSLTAGSAYLMIASLLFMISGYIGNIWIGRFLGPVKYGVYGLVISLVTLINLIQTSGLPQAVSKYIAEDEKKAKEILKSGSILQISTTLFFSIIFFISAGFFSKIFHDSSLTLYIQISSLIFPIYGMYSLYIGYYNGLHYFKQQSFIQSTYAIVKVITIIVLAYFFGLFGVFFSFILSPLIALTGGFYIPWIKESFSFKKLIFFSIPLILLAIFSSLLLSIDIYFVKMLIHIPQATGIYTATQNIARIPYFGLSAFALVLFPGISKSVSEGNQEKTKKLIENSFRYMLILLTPCVLFMAVTSASLMHIIYGKVYTSGAFSLSILLFGMGFLTIFILLSNVLSGGGKPLLATIIAAIGVMLTAFFCIILIPRYGLEGAASATTIGSLGAMILASIMILRRFSRLINLKSAIHILIPAIILSIPLSFVHVFTILWPFVYGFFFICYLGSLFLLREITYVDTERFKNLIFKEKTSL